ncbi:hypothetical protein Ae706Ps2_6448c [Pseudonocardia sp. Ae706_Ps2]|uniref:hypothetical protein n=1 Tax=Pseudonocardia sp. Ae706_Ps2 TaxID=1885035 RepID=UPI0009635881|nr:hypothetical protein [Pseudonocardia sp. Ae706_Ps2]OLM09411.1 hypothetical protein Ae706Ps2_6432c [Pseudonocardia sp. Ae706_Ps2]OLM09426.1 hypothetical protein Ae706Ps2_6448c [Pseudonocardia sp. Ae706_Ps2]
MVLVLAGCVVSDGPLPVGTGPVGVPMPRAFDPPSDFGAPTVWMSRVEDAPVPMVHVLDGVAGWRADAEGLTRVDFLTHTVHPGVRPDNPLGGGLGDRRGGDLAVDVLGNPVVADTALGRIVLAAFPVEVPAAGTSPTGHGVELVAADSATATKRLSVTVPVPALTPGSGPGIGWSSVLGVHDSLVLVSATSTAGGFVAGIDLVSGIVVWTVPAMVGLMIVGDTVVVKHGSGPDTDVRGLSAVDGTQRWEGVESGAVNRIGDRQVLVGTPQRGSAVFDAVTGSEVVSSLSGRLAGWRCLDDGDSVTVCQVSQNAKPYAVLGFDRTGAELWRIVDEPGSTRVPPMVTAVWHGAVYGYTWGSDAGLVLDARTGADRTPAATAAPILVNEYFGIAPAPRPKSSGFSNDQRGFSETVAVPAIS